jgi:DNA-binding HxlR family transcriptional regulator
MSTLEATVKFRSTCPIARTLDIVGDKWTLLIIRDLAVGKTHFDELLGSREGIAPNILANRLQMLTALGLVERNAVPADRRRVQYQLTQRGEEFRSLAKLLAQWGMAHMPGVEHMTAERL